MSFVMLVVMVMGTLMYVVAGPENGYTSIPIAVYWAITTMTTVGFGDITQRAVLPRLRCGVAALAQARCGVGQGPDIGPDTGLMRGRGFL